MKGRPGKQRDERKVGVDFRWREKGVERMSGKGVGRRGLDVISLKVPMNSSDV